MRYRPFRSWTFWLGVPGLIFLLWAWADSMFYNSQLSLETVFLLEKGRTFSGRDSISNSGADVSISWALSDGSGSKLLSRKFGSTQRDAYDHTEWFPLPSYLVTRNYHGRIYHNLSTPHWFLLLCYAFGWTVLILVQWLVVKRIKARQLALHEESRAT